MSYDIGLNKRIDDKTFRYRLNRLFFSQNMIKTFFRSKEEFYEKYILGVFWNDGTEEDIKYMENMEYGRDFHLDCQRMFLGIPVRINDRNKSISNVEKIKRQYESRFGRENIVYMPECMIEGRNRLKIIADLIIKVYEEGELKRVDIWDWKMESDKLDEFRVKKSIQTKMYMYLVYESMCKRYPYDILRMSYYQPMSNNRVDVSYSEEVHKNYKNDIDAIIDEILEGKWL